ncbi:peptidoglycan DD-metalloendopeptidase family protein [Peptoniphilus equinus]|uniref:Peptidoglycan DD-metalloendopeptidase family protein n=1 Tax=Peptoniphilus equinus TaxID=3016343 RepID=A0ABY7QSQ1_9FIRM|nr:peptidoglycan DD-metalloendopeptidase family protein [Peptoniphilus equinus]WBW49320.1 peptidoglycan DD-metalloendopeptidase family protein [Peptoniphilus equinus]
MKQSYHNKNTNHAKVDKATMEKNKHDYQYTHHNGREDNFSKKQQEANSQAYLDKNEWSKKEYEVRRQYYNRDSDSDGVIDTSDFHPYDSSIQEAHELQRGEHGERQRKYAEDLRKEENKKAEENKTAYERQQEEARRKEDELRRQETSDYGSQVYTSTPMRPTYYGLTRDEDTNISSLKQHSNDTLPQDANSFTSEARVVNLKDRSDRYKQTKATIKQAKDTSYTDARRGEQSQKRNSQKEKYRHKQAKKYHDAEVKAEKEQAELENLQSSYDRQKEEAEKKRQQLDQQSLGFYDKILSTETNNVWRNNNFKTWDITQEVTSLAGTAKIENRVVNLKDRTKRFKKSKGILKQGKDSSFLFLRDQSAVKAKRSKKIQRRMIRDHRHSDELHDDYERRQRYYNRDSDSDGVIDTSDFHPYDSSIQEAFELDKNQQKFKTESDNSSLVVKKESNLKNKQAQQFNKDHEFSDKLQEQNKSSKNKRGIRLPTDQLLYGVQRKFETLERLNGDENVGVETTAKTGKNTTKAIRKIRQKRKIHKELRALKEAQKEAKAQDNASKIKFSGGAPKGTYKTDKQSFIGKIKHNYERNKSFRLERKRILQRNPTRLRERVVNTIDNLNADRNIGVDTAIKPIHRIQQAKQSTRKAKSLNKFYQKQKNKALARHKKGVGNDIKSTLFERFKRFVTPIPLQESSVGKIVVIMVILICLMVFLFVSCTATFTSLAGYIASTSYVASFQDVTKADKFYSKLEADLAYEQENIESVYPGYDEYRVTKGQIGHDPHLLIAYLTVKYGDFKTEDVEGELREIFKWHYQYQVTKKTETRYRRVRVRGQIVNQPYQVRILEATLFVNDLETVLKNRLGGSGISGGTALSPEQIEAFGGFVNPLGKSNYRVSSNYGYRVHPILGTRKFHEGIDLAEPSGTPVYAVMGGTIVNAKWTGTYGNAIYIDHGNGVQTRYAHLSSLNVKVGQIVAPGDYIGGVGSTGQSTGPHLHFEVRINGKTTDPLPYLKGTEKAPVSGESVTPSNPEGSSEPDVIEETQAEAIERFDIYMESKGNFMFYESPFGNDDWKPKIKKMFGYVYNPETRQVETQNTLDLQGGSKVYAVSDGEITSSGNSATITDETNWTITYIGVNTSKAGHVKVGEELGLSSDVLKIEIRDENGELINPYFHLYSESRLGSNSFTNPELGSYDFATAWGQGGEMPQEATPINDLFEATAYTSNPSENGGYTITAMGTPLQRGVIAVDPNVIPLGSKIWVEGYGVGRAEDTGGAIKGRRLDLLMDSTEEANQWGRRMVRVAMLPDNYQPEPNISVKGQAILNEAQKWLGTPYVYGAKNITKGGIDCSGFVCWVYNNSGWGGRKINTGSHGLYDMSQKISAQEAKPGDLVFFKHTFKDASHPWGSVTHVGIYMGNGKMIHAGNPVNITSIDSSYWQGKFVGFGRIN